MTRYIWRFQTVLGTRVLVRGHSETSAFTRKEAGLPVPFQKCPCVSSLIFDFVISQVRIPWCAAILHKFLITFESRALRLWP